MGAWGTGPFENDDALDFASEIRTVDNLLAQVRHCDVGETLDADKACRVIVVAECVAAMRGHSHSDLPDDLAERLRAFGPPSDELFDGARDAVSIVISSSELSDLWAESDDRGGFNRFMTDLIDRLNQPIASEAGSPATKKSSSERNACPCWICGEEMGEEFTSISVNLDPKLGMSQGGSVHLVCLNAALHPKFMIQDWQFDDEMLARFTGGDWGGEGAD